MQFDADTVGSASPAADAEMCMMAADAMEALGIPRGSYVVKVNNRKVLDGVLESIGLGGDEHAGRRLTVLRAIDKLDKFGPDGVRLLLGEGRKDDSGDFTKGAGLAGEAIEQVIAFTEGKPAGESKLLNEGRDELEQIRALVTAGGYGEDRIRVDPSVVRGLEYYTGPVYEVELLLETKDEKDRPVRFGSVGGGGRYDGLVSRFRGEPVPATGFSIGVSRLQAALTMLGKLDTTPEFGPVVVVVMDRNEIAQYQKFVAMLRNDGIRAEMYLGNPKNNLGVQFKYADRRNSPCVVIQGGDEKARGEVQIKDLIIGAEIASLSSDHDDYRQNQAQAQFACKESELVAKVREVLARHGVKWG
jgi:histidyl-tRNA synthetase